MYKIIKYKIIKYKKYYYEMRNKIKQIFINSLYKMVMTMKH